MKLKIISTALWICFFCLQIFSATIIVIPSDTVYASISAGVADAQPGDTVLVRAGKYTAGAYLGSNNGTEGKMITIKNYPGEMPEINGWKDESTVNGGSAFSNPQDKPVNFVRIEGFYVTGFQFGALSIN